jgi:hypothetical protein
MGLGLPTAFPLVLLKTTGRGMLGPKYFGPYQVQERVGDVVYQLQLPVSAKLHNVFNVGMLKMYNGEPPETLVPLPPIRHGRAMSYWFTGAGWRLQSCLSQGRHELLVHWKGQDAADDAADATWMELDESRKLFPTFQLEDELIV